MDLLDPPVLDDPVLDNPAWHALRGPHRGFARSNARAARYDPHVAPFAALAEAADPAAWVELAKLLGPDEHVVLAAPRLDLPPTWETAMRLDGVQMVGPAGAGTLRAGPKVVPLGADDVPEMLDLVARARPGPFRARTVELGGYRGVRQGDRLVAMAGHRMRLPGFTEISAVCTDPELRGRGLAGALVSEVVAAISARGEQAFLHASADNVGALRLYEALGFTTRRTLAFAAARPLDP